MLPATNSRATVFSCPHSFHVRPAFHRCRSNFGVSPRRQYFRAGRPRRAAAQVVAETAAVEVVGEDKIEGMQDLLNGLKWNDAGLVAVIVQNVDTGDICMQAFADRAAICETMQTGLATFYSRSRKERWCKGETSGNYIHVKGIFPDCDKDSIIYLGDPIGPSCHTGETTCWFSEVGLSGDRKNVVEARIVPSTTLFALENTIEERKQAAANGSGKKSWTGKLLSDEALLCEKIREEASELCQTLEQKEGKDRAASEMADVLYHSMVLLNKQGVKMEDVLRVLRGRFGTSGIEEKSSRTRD
ncbi:hypothetical protein BSKO_11143 [Bryopsis sp. KO-2023]|nr:hypothetical protein BSKO_11143 [Bryopsis sp. KO-2023]